MGGIPEKIYGAKQAGLSRVFLPKDNAAEVPSGLDHIRVTDFESVADVVNAIFEK
ncbi:MAG: hypothetical protein IJO94_04385 [Firmicutes bacterium]|nr:hypothetical protein [Bacillota bacterium]